MNRPFEFQSSASLVKHTGFSADNVRALLKGLQRVPGSSIFYHVHHALFRRHFTMGEFMNDFARWALTALGEEALAERLSAVDPLQCQSIRGAREALAKVISDQLGASEFVAHVPPGKRFFFSQAQTFVFPTGRTAQNLREFANEIRRVGVDTIFHHFVTAPSRLGRNDNDFSAWMAEELGEPELARQVRMLSPYTYDLFQLREQIGQLVDRSLGDERQRESPPSLR
ncbi:MAG: DUF5752 family protein [Deltaproteobacteria bacterium]